MITKRISVKSIIAKVYRDLQLTEEVNWQDMIEWCGEALEHIGTIGQTDHKVVKLTVEDYKTVIPCDFLALEGPIIYNNHPLRRATSTFGNLATNGGQSATDQTAVSNIDTDVLQDPTYTGEETYTMDPVYIKTSFRDGVITMAYTAFPLDEDGFPEVPDDISFREALFSYIVKKLKYIDYLDEKISENRYHRLERTWDFYCKQAAGKMQMPDLDQLESIKNWSLRLLPNINDHATYFANLGREQHLHKGNSTL
jgi:hypothetical protein